MHSLETRRPVLGVMLIAPAGCFLCALFLFPVLNVVRMSVSEPDIGFASYVSFFSEPLYLDVLARTFFVAFVVTAICALVAYPLAYVAVRLPGGVGLAILGAIALSFWTSYLVRAYAWMVILGRNGPAAQLLSWLGMVSQPQMLYTSTSMYIGLVHALLPYMMLTMYAVMRKIERRYLLAAANLGASPSYVFVTVFLPLSLPGIINGCTLVFVFCLGFYVTPALLGGSSDIMLPSMIGQQMNQLLEWGMAGAMTTVLMASTFAILALYNRLFGLNRLWG